MREKEKEEEKKKKNTESSGPKKLDLTSEGK